MRRAVLCTVMGLIASLVAMSPSAAATPPRAARPLSLVECGAALARPGGGLWVCTFADEFNGTSLDRTKWLPADQLRHGRVVAPGAVLPRRQPRQRRVGQGNLKLTVRKASTPVACKGKRANYTSGHGHHLPHVQSAVRPLRGTDEGPTPRPVPSAGSRRPSGCGPTIATRPAVAGRRRDRRRRALLEIQHVRHPVPPLHVERQRGRQARCQHRQLPGIAGRVQHLHPDLDADHADDRLVNGTTCLVNTSGDPAFQKPYIVAFSQALGVGANRLRTNTPIPATMHVDYIRVWR